MRIDAAVPSLRREHVARVVREVIRAGGHREGFRVVQFNLLANHLHLLIEAAGQAALSRGMQGLAVRLARRINAEFDRRGRLFAQRPIATPRTWLAAEGWRRGGGLIDVDEVPGRR